MSLYEDIMKLNKTFSSLKELYEKSEKPQDKKDPALFSYVKQQTLPIFKDIDNWKENALEFVKQRSVAVHPQQIESTAENLELLLMHSYYIDVKRKRYMELYQSIVYVFDLLLKDLESNTK